MLTVLVVFLLEMKLNSFGDISLSAEIKSNKMSFNLKSQGDSVKYESELSIGTHKSVLSGSFGKFVVLIKVSELKSKVKEENQVLDILKVNHLVFLIIRLMISI